MLDRSTFTRSAGGFIFLLLIFAVSVCFAQRTVVVDSTAYGGLNYAIDSDTTETGARVDSSTVYILKRGETYILNGAISHEGYTLTVQAEEGEGALPKLVPGVSDGGESDRPFRPRGNLTLRDLSLTNRDELGGLNTRTIRVSEDNVRLIIDGCVSDEDGQAFIRLDNPGCKVYITNSIISRIGTPDNVDNGRVIDDRGNQVDTVFMQNNTFYNISQRIYRDGGNVKNHVFFDHNTVVNVGVFLAVFGEVVDFTFTNNLIINPGFLGTGQNKLESGEPDPDDLPGALVNMDTVAQNYLDSLGFTQSAKISNNNLYVRQSILDARPAENPDPAIDELVVSRPVWSQAIVAWVENNGTGETNIEENVVFKNEPVDPTVLIQQWWADPLHEDVDPWDITGAPFEFNYNDNFQSAIAGTENDPLGDSNWETIPTGVQPLRAAIAVAETILDNAEIGTDPGQYPQGAADAYQTAIDAAQVVADDLSSTETDYNNAVNDLAEATEIFLDSRIGDERIVVVDSTGYGGLNHAIASDTTITGARIDSSTVYVLKRGETYILNGAISHEGYHLTVRAEAGDGPLPHLLPGVSDGGESDRPFRPRGDLTLRELSLTNRNEIGGLNTRTIRVSEDNVRIVVDQCVSDEDGQSFIRLDNPGIKVYITSSIISRIGTPDNVDNGRIIDDRGNDVDTVVMQNNTFYNISQRIYRDGGGVKKYVLVDQNTMNNIGVFCGVFGEVVDFTFRDNLIINPGFLGTGQDKLENGEPDPADTPGALISIDTVNQDYLDQIGATQSAIISNNNILVRQAVLDVRPDENPDPVIDELVVSRPEWSPTAVAWMENNGTTDTNITEDVIFKNGAVDPTEFITQWWADPLHEDVDPWDMTGAPYEFNYRDNYVSATASSLGIQLGDLNWDLSASGLQGLLDAIDEAEDILANASIGSNIGDFPQSAADDLQDAVDAATVVAEDPSSTAEEIEAATTALEAAIAAFEGTLITGLTDGLGNELVKIYPNPTSGIVELEMAESVQMISVWNTTGKQLMQIDNISRKEMPVNISGFESGIYILKVQFENGEVLTDKILKY
jgi:hypothetical protein